MIDKLEKKRIEWKKFYDIKNELFALILKKTKILDDSSSKFHRYICFTEDKELLKKIEILSKELNSQYKIASQKNNDYRELPIILKDVENIIINSYDSYSSYKFEKGDIKALLGTVQVNSVTELENEWGKMYQKNLKKYKLIENREKNKIIMRMEDILDLANAKVIQRRNFTGLRYVLNIRKVGENVSTRYKYGIIIIDKKAVIKNANKEAERKHSLNISGVRVKFPFSTNLDCDLFIKEKN